MRSAYVLGAETGDETSFWNAWTWIKSRINALRSLPAELTAKQHEVAIKAAAAGQAGDKKTQEALKASIMRLGVMARTADQVKATIDEWLPKWTQAEAGAGSVSGLGLPVALILGAAGIAAAAWVAYAGAGLLAQYTQEKSILADVEAGKLTMEQAAALIKATKSPTAAEAFAGGFAKAAIPIAIVLGLAGIGFLYYRTRTA
jgi:hypothetical protein